MVSLTVGTHSPQSCVEGAWPSSVTPLHFIELLVFVPRRLSAWPEPRRVCPGVGVLLLGLEEDYGQRSQSGCLSRSNSLQKGEKPP